MHFNMVWAMTPDALARVASGLYQYTMNPAAYAIKETRRPQAYAKAGRVAVVPIHGVLMKNPGALASLLGAGSMGEAKAAIEQAAADSAIDYILLDVDSPGGNVDGMAELADAVFKARQEKAVIAQACGLIASAAYYIASQADMIFAHRMDSVGSIGVRLLLHDYSAMFDREGIKAIPIDTGAFKSAGAPGTEITEDQIAYFQAMVDDHFADFLAVVRRGRKLNFAQIRKSADGRIFLAEDAVKRNLIDGIQTTAETLAMLNSSGTARVRQRMNT